MTHMIMNGDGVLFTFSCGTVSLTFSRHGKGIRSITVGVRVMDELNMGIRIGHGRGSLKDAMAWLNMALIGNRVIIAGESEQWSILLVTLESKKQNRGIYFG